jgi:hypothetical protein
MQDRCVTLWIGPRLGRVERACMRSVLRQGHELALYCYAVPEGVPKGVELRDAAAVLSEDRIVRHRSGSVALFANLFRYELLRRGAGIWLDTDIYLVAPLPPAQPYLFGREDGALINTAVLGMPPDSPLLPPLLSIFEEQEVPFWLPPRARLGAALRLRLTGRTGLSRMPWGSAGPRAFTALARRAGLDSLALPSRVFYPAHYRDAAWIRDPNRRLEDVISPDTAAVHLWHELIKGWAEAATAPGSFLARLHEEGR